MNAKILLAIAATVSLAGSAHADFFVIENQSTHKCSIVTQEPMPGTIDAAVGDAGYRTLQEAEAAMRAAHACSNTPMGNVTTPTPSGTDNRTLSKCGSYLAQLPCRQ